MKRPVLWMVTAGDKNAGITREARMERIQKGDAAAMGTDPVHEFFVIADEDDGGVGAAMTAAWERLGAKTSDDLPKPFNMARVDESKYVVAKKFRLKERKR